MLQLGCRALYSSHSEDRMSERNITKAEVDSVIENPEFKVPARQGRHKVGKRISGKIVWVVYYLMEDGAPFVISVMKDEEQS